MSLEIKVPTVGESITEVTISEWLKQDGDYVELDEIICELESDKASFELNAEAAGILNIKAQEGETLEIGAVICEIDTDAGKPASDEDGREQEQQGEQEVERKTEPAEEPSVAVAPAVADIIEMRVPEVGESITEVTLASWIKNDGDYVELDENIADIDSDKASFELPAEANGTLRIVAKEGDILEIGALICKIEVSEAPVAAPENKEAPAATAQVATATGSYAKGHPSPAAAKILAEKGHFTRSSNWYRS